ncbi:MAG: GNAT family N-acetyltransferase [Enterobacterales bacterium]|nr:GNAT family N-acetyltransferase [Enterobacterales bacterium]
MVGAKEKTLFGGNHTEGRDDSLSNPTIDPARVRAMYTHPQWIRKGIAAQLIRLSEKAARDYGFKQIELGSTIAGHQFYLKQGYYDIERYERRSDNGAIDTIIKMRKAL